MSNIEKIYLWEDNPQKDRISNVVRINFQQPILWTLLTVNELKQIIKLWVIGEEKKYPLEAGFKGRWLLIEELLKMFDIYIKPLYKYMCDNCKNSFYDMNLITECPKCNNKAIHIVTSLKVVQ